MQQYLTFTHLVGLKDSNLSPYRDARVKRYNSVQRIMDLLQIAKMTRPFIPNQTLMLDQNDPQWDDLMPFPTVDRVKYVKYGLAMVGLLSFYSYNYNVFTYNIRFRTWRCLFPLTVGALFVSAYTKYRTQILKINLFDEYCFLRSQQLVKQNEYLFNHQDFERNVWWRKDFEQTLKKVHRQGNDNHQRDFADSQIILQDFINRYVNPNDESPMKPYALRQYISPMAAN